MRASHYAMLCAALIGLAWAGCGRKADSSAINDPNSPGYIPPAENQTLMVNGAVDLAGLTEAVRAYAKWKMRVPKDVNELVASKYLAEIPAAPPGRKYTINPSTLEVTLESQ